MRRAAGSAAVAFVLVVLAAPVGLAGAPSELLPDLIVRRATGLAIRSVAGGRERLRFTTTTANLGVGVVELHPRKDDCDGDGDFEDDRTALQRTFLDQNGNGRFDPSTDPVSRELVVGCFVFHAPHRHWHFEDFARYRLVSTRTGRVVSHQAKVGFCVVDNYRWRPGVPGSPQDAYYSTCRVDGVQGLSPGWADVYPAFLPAQWLDVTDLTPGRYCLVQRIDPGDAIRESDEANNVSRLPVRIRGVRVRGLTGSC
jgi:lysyl oxidase